MADANRTAQNRLLAALAPDDSAELLRELEPVSMTFNERLYRAQEPVTHVYFPVTAVASMVTVMEDGARVEIATVGNEGMIGLSVLLEAGSADHEAFVQVPGELLRMPADAFGRHVEQGLQTVLLRYTQALLGQIGRAVGCNAVHPIQARCSRWLLQTHDRVGSDEFPLTQEFLAQMLGVRRASVSEVAGGLRDAGSIRYSRGRMTILDREGLETRACECYRDTRREYDRLIP